ncbi:glycosyltransferase [Methylacidimicrobium sp. B4]|uniref:glycosyltransferase n=1 Tax=Methylacidimicrobium sp. B4 TaxID=2796139 RepID=UPI001A8E6172|nr:glycosyltransferase [Methylacidimicrobium sp. B4]QSR85452.1 glycosyltransferase [Methylacidimicrobium sp. B4]
MRPPRVLVLAPLLARSSGGLASAVSALSELLCSAGWGLRVLTTDLGASRDEERARLDARASCSVFPVGNGWNRWMYRSPELIGWVRSHIRDYDLLDIQGVWLDVAVAAARAAFESGVPYVFTPHGQASRQDRKKKLWKKLLFQKLLLEEAWRRAAAIRFLVEEEKELCALPPHPGSVVIPNFVRIPSLSQEEKERGAARISWDGPVILFLGRISPQKGVLEILSAFERVYRSRPDVHLVVAGPDQGSYGAWVRTQASQMAGKAHVHFVGPVYDAEKWALLSSASLFVTLSRNEGLPMAVIEALGAGVPILITAEANVGAAVEAGAGCLVRLEDLDGVAGRMLEILGNAELRERMSRNARRFFAERYSCEAVRGDLLSFYERLSGPARGSGTGEGRGNRAE